jgi:tetratricopeptide (TPR) repeat protein
MRTRRRELHGLAVQALEKIYGDNIPFHYAELAYHAELAELREKAQRYYSLAGRSAAQAYQNRKGIEYLSRALSLTPFRDQDAQFDLLVERIELFKRLGEHTSHLEDLHSLLRLAHDLGYARRQALVEMLFTHYFILVSDYPAAIEHAERVMDLSRSHRDPDILLKTYQVWPFAHLRLGRPQEAMRIAREGRQLALEFADPLNEGYMLVTMGLIAIEQREPTTAHGYLEEALATALQTRDRRLESRALGNLGYSAGFVLQDYALARDY